MSFIYLFKSDLKRSNLIPKKGGYKSYLKIFFLPLYLQARVLFLIRVATAESHIVAKFGRLILRTFYSIEVGANVKIGSALFLPHPMCIILGSGVVIGDEVSIAQFVTIGGNYRKTKCRDRLIQKLPIIGCQVIIGPGSVIGGPVIIGDNVIVGANSVITKDIPSNKLVYGLSQISNKKIIVDITGAYTIYHDDDHSV